MGDVFRARFAEDVVVGHCEAKTSAKVDEVEAAFGGEVCEGNFAMDGHLGRDVVFVDGLEAGGVQLEDSLVELCDCIRVTCVYWSDGERWSQEQIVKLKTGVDGFLASSADIL